MLSTALVTRAGADDFGAGSNLFSISFIEIGNIENIGDPANLENGINPGSVDYSYRMGTYEITVDQYSKALSEDNRIGNGDEGYWNDGIRTVGESAPVSHVSWYEAAKFANWLTTGDAYNGAYEFETNGTLIAVNRDAAKQAYGTVYVLPSNDEWYKTAYFNPTNNGTYSVYSSGADNTPTRGTNGWNFAVWEWDQYGVLTNVNTVLPEPNLMWERGFGSPEQNGTFDINGNIWEWCESAYDGILDTMEEGRIIRGGGQESRNVHMQSSFLHDSFSPTSEHMLVGFRVAAIPASEYWLKVTTNGNGSVNVTNGWQPIGTNLILVATADTNWLFMGWSGDLSGDYMATSTNLTMNSDKAITAIFSDDADGDGLLNSIESSLGTSPRNSDSDADGLPDGWEVRFTLDPLVTNALDDVDLDGFGNLYEFALGGDPTNALDTGYVPSYRVVIVGGTNQLDYIHAQRTNAANTGLTYTLELTDDAVSGTWTNGGYAQTGQSIVSNGFMSITNRIAPWSSTNLYLRLAVSTSNEVVYSDSIVITPLIFWAGGFGLYGTNAISSADPDADGLDNQAEFAAATNPTLADSDGDSLLDGDEVNLYGTDPLDEDTDDDLIFDGVEIAAGLDPQSSNTGIDSDADGLNDENEVNTLGTDPLDFDSDHDGLPDGWEVRFTLDPLATNALDDVDLDGFENLYEFALGGDPTNALDTGYVPSYRVVIVGGTNQLDYIHAQRTNAVNTGLTYTLELTDDAVSGTWTNGGYAQTGQSIVSNGFMSITNRIAPWSSTNLYLRLAVSTSNEVVYSDSIVITPLTFWTGGFGLYGTNAISSADPDADGLDNQAEFAAATNPTLEDSDGDSLLDGDEVNLYGTDPLDRDTDADTFDDGQEITHGGSPLISDSWRIDHIRNHGNKYNLYSSNSVLDISIGQAAFMVTNGTAWLSLQLEESQNLITWSNVGDEVIWSIPVDLSNAFYRVRSGR